MDIGEHYTLRGAMVVDGLGGDPRQDLAVTVRGGRIVRVGPADQLTDDDAGQVVDLAGSWLMPGLIDAHVHLAGARANISEQEMGAVSEPPLMRAVRSVRDSQAILRRGFTAVRDVSWNGLYLKRLFLEQQTPGPKVIACGPGLTRTGGHADMFQFTPEYSGSHGPWGLVADGPDGMQKAVRSLLREGADAIKIFLSGGDNWPHDRNSDVHYSREELQAAVDEAHRTIGTIVMCHAENRESIQMAIEAGVDTIEHGEELDADLAGQMAARGIVLVPTLELIANWHRDFIPLDDPPPVHRTHAFLYRDVYDSAEESGAAGYRDDALASFRTALRAGVPIALGSDTVFEPITPYGEYGIRELLALVEHGMTPSEAIVAGTSVAARALGMAHRIGSVEAGKRADLLVLHEDPTANVAIFQDPSSIQFVICDGRVAVADGQLAW